MPLFRSPLLIALALVASAGIAACGQAQTHGAAETTPQRVSTLAELESALMRSDGTSVIEIAPGNYATLELRDIHPKNPVVITSEDGERPSVLEGISLRNTSNLKFHNLAIRPPKTGNKAGRYGFLILQSSDIIIDGLSFVGPGSKIERRYISGLMLRESRRITVTKSYFSNFWHGLSLLNLSDSRIALNEFEGLQTDAIRGGGVSDTRLENNVMTNFRPAKGDHPDGIQLWSTHQNEPGRNIHIAHNLVNRGSGSPIQGIFIRDTYSQLPFENIEIRNNLVLGSLYNGISVMGANGVNISGNAVYGTSDQKSWIRMQKVMEANLTGNSAQQYIFIENLVEVFQKSNFEIPPIDEGQAKKIAEWVENASGFSGYRGPVLRRLMIKGR